ncbi:SET domain-containing protein-lysine N-methyltransferase [Colwellia sp. MEBiC06753]
MIKTPKVYIKQVSSSIGRGVFARQNFTKGQVVEVAPVILLSGQYQQFPIEIKDRVFNWGHLTNTAPVSALVLGYGSIYNHANQPNLRYEACTEQKTLSFVALTEIAEGDQLTIHYDEASGQHQASANDWFERHDVIPQVLVNK